MDKLDAALAWARRGFRVFPLVEGGKRPLPSMDDWPSRATRDEGAIFDWWFDPITGGSRGYNIGVDTTGRTVVDLDNKDGRNGQGHYEELGGRFDTLTVRTPTGGFHLYYDPAGVDYANSADRIGRGIDTRGYHGYVVAPGSETAQGRYDVLLDAPIAPLPEFVAGRLKKANGSAPLADRILGVPELDTPPAIAAAVEYLRGTEPAVEGAGGDNRTYQVCCEVRDRGVSEALALDLLLDHWNERCAPPWQPDELRAKVENAYAYAQRREGEKAPIVYFGGVTYVEPEIIVPPAAAVPAWGNLPALSALAPRPWVLHRMLLRGEVTALVAPGGAGKSQFALTLAIHLALGSPKIFGFHNKLEGPARSLIYNAEDSLDEMARRIYATCAWLNVDPVRVAPYLALVSGKTERLRVTEGRDTPKVKSDHVARIIEAAQGAALIAIDPLSKLHDSNENDNTAMGYVMDTLEMVARRAGAAMLVAHHVSKPTGADSHAGSANAGRGAKAIIDSARASFTLEAMSPVDATTYGIPAEERGRYLRLDDAKMNRALVRDRATWIYKHTVKLWTGDEVGAFAEVDIEDRAQFVRQSVAATLIAEMTGLAQATLDVASAAELIRRAHALYAKLTLTVVKQRLESMFSGTPCEVDGQGLLRLEEKPKKMFVLE